MFFLSRKEKEVRRKEEVTRGEVTRGESNKEKKGNREVYKRTRLLGQIY